MPLDDNVWAEEQISDRCLCIHERLDDLNHQCSFPCLYDSTTFSMDLLPSTRQNEAVFNYEQMDFIYIWSDLCDIMMTTSEIMDLADVSDAVWFT